MLATDLQFIITSIGWSLIHFLWQGTLITLAYWVITRNLVSIHAKYWTGMTLVLFSLLIPIFNLGSSQVTALDQQNITQLTTTYISPQQMNWEGLVLYITNESLPFLVLTWAITVLFLSIRLIRSWLSLRSIQHNCDPKISNEFKQYVKNIAIKLDLPSIPVLKISRQVMVPAAYGVFKPTILLPLSIISQIPKDQLEAILKHELCHLKRNDFIHNIIQLCADILLFFHPGIRWMNNDIRHIREQCCDQMVLSHNTKPLTYAKALTNIAAFTNGIKMQQSVSLGINDGMLLSRVKFLLQNKSSQSSLMIFMPLLLMLIFIMVMMKPATQSGETTAAINPQNTARMVSSERAQQKPTAMKMGNQPFYPKFNNSKPEATALDYGNPVSSFRQQLPITPDNDRLSDSRTLYPSELQAAMTQDLSSLKPQQADLLSDYSTMQVTLPAITPDNSISIGEEKVESPQTANAGPLTATNAQSELSSFKNTSSIRPLFSNYEAPEYPKELWINQIEQEVIATFKISPNGRVDSIKLTSLNNNFVAFEQEVERVMKRWRFNESSLNGSTLQRTYQQIFSFNIAEHSEYNCQQKTTGSRIRKPMPCMKQ